MPLNLPTTGGDYTPFIKYNAKAGRFYIRVDDADQEVVNPTLVIDMPNILTGWIKFPMSGPPQTSWNTDMPPEGDKGWKRGFKVNVCGEPPVGEREWMSNSINCNAAMVRMYADWENSAEHTDPTKVPWYRFVRVEGVHGQYGTNYEPIFELMGFTERAGRFTEAAASPQGAPASNPAPSTAQPQTAAPDAPERYDERNPPPVNEAPGGQQFDPELNDRIDL